jgi:hypothetical protein
MDGSFLTSLENSHPNRIPGTEGFEPITVALPENFWRKSGNMIALDGAPDFKRDFYWHFKTVLFILTAKLSKELPTILTTFVCFRNSYLLISNTSSKF